MTITSPNDIIRSGRRSIFPQFFTNEPISRATLEHLLENANWAPSHRQTEPWRFVIFRGEAREELADQFADRYRTVVPVDKQDEKKINKTRKKMLAADTLIGIVLHRDPEERVPEWEEIAAVAMAVQNIWLSLDQYGLGGYWSSPGILTSEYGIFPWLAKNERCLGIFYLGHHDAPELPRKRGNWREKVSWKE
ncbi:MAG: nitroreductase [Bacteroidota bacterium]